MTSEQAEIKQSEIEQSLIVVDRFFEGFKEALLAASHTKKWVKQTLHHGGGSRCPVHLKRLSNDIILRYPKELGDLFGQYPDDVYFSSPNGIFVGYQPPDRKDPVDPVRVLIVTDDQQGNLARITNVISEDGTNIKTVDARVSEDRQGMVTLVLDIRDTEHLENVLRRLRRTEGVRSAHRHEG